MTDDTRTCSDPDCSRPAQYGGSGLCRAHSERRRNGSRLTGPIGKTAIANVGDDVFMHCPEQLLDLAGWCADNDAKAIVRALWPHFLEASLAGVEPFTLDEAS